jgi:hypothetical protein
MQPTTRFHDGLAPSILHEADGVFDHPRAFHIANGMFKADADRRDPTISRFLRRGEFTPMGLFLGLDESDAGQDTFLEAQCLI